MNFRTGRDSLGPLHGNLLNGLPQSPEVTGDHGGEDGEHRATEWALVEADRLDERAFIR